MGFDLIQGVIDLLLLVAGAISIVYLRVVRLRMRQLAIEKVRHLPAKDPVDDTARSASLSFASHLESRRDNIASRENREVSEVKSLLAKMTLERSRLQVAFYDAERMIEDLESLQAGSRSSSPGAVISPPSDTASDPPPVSAVSGKPPPLSDQEKAVSWSRSGQSVSEIAQRLGRSEGEVELILGMARLTGGGAE